MASDASTVATSALQVKTCTKCGETKPLEGFSKGKKNGLRAQCKSCERAASAAYRAANSDAVSAYDAQYKAKNAGILREKARTKAARLRADDPDLVNARKREWHKNNPDKANQTKRAWYASNAEKVCESVRLKRTSPSGKINNNLRARIYQSLTSRGAMKGGLATFDILDYTRQSLIDHLERHFSPGMTWDNYGPAWHVDHIMPLDSFEYATTECPGFKAAWALTNLQPLWALDNMSKGARLDHPSQVHLLAANEY